MARVPTDWNQESVLAGVQSAFQAHLDIGLYLHLQRFHVPQHQVGAFQSREMESSTRDAMSSWRFDGDATAYQLMTEGYVDATGVQMSISRTRLQAIADARPERPCPPESMTGASPSLPGEPEATSHPRMWGPSNLALRGRDPTAMPA